jgi:hypothetical protein
VNPELAAIAADPANRLVPFLERVAPAPLGPLGTLHSLTVIDDGGGAAATRRKYRVVFGETAPIVCTVEIGGAGRHVAVHWSRSQDEKSSS